MVKTVLRLGAGTLFVALGAVMFSAQNTNAAEQAEADKVIFEQAQERESTRAGLVAEHMAAILEQLVREEAGDPAVLDEATLGRLIEKHELAAWREAETWRRGLDDSALPLANPKPNYACTNKYERFKCKADESCNYGGKESYCFVTNCGEGRCPACPKLFNLDALIVHGWCTYACMGMSGSTLLGTKIVVHIAFNRTISKCLALETPIP